MLIDTSFDFRTDTPSGKDPDAHSPTLRRYHKLLWSKPLPNGRHFELADTVRGVYLHHRSELGEVLSVQRLGHPHVHEVAFPEAHPGNRIEGKWTINQARGCLPKISDRLDLTLECRRYYLGQRSPLGETLARYRGFFALFNSFSEYVNFFMLQDLVTGDCSAVMFFMPFDDFKTPSVPKDGDSYRVYRRLSIEFIEARNRRIARYADDLR